MSDSKIQNNLWYLVLPNWSNWRSKTSIEQKPGHYISITDALNSYLMEKGIFGEIKYTGLSDLEKQGTNRKQKLHTYREFSKVAYFVAIPATIYFGINYKPVVLDHMKDQYGISIIAILLSYFSIGFCRLNIEKLLHQTIQPDILSLIDADGVAKKTISDFLSLIVRENSIIYIKEANGKFKSLPDTFLNEDCATTSLIAHEKFRNAVALMGLPPYGKYYITREKFVDVIKAKPDNKLTGFDKIYLRHTRWLMRDPTRIKSFIDFVERQNKKKNVPVDYSLTNNRIAWFEAVKHLLQNHEKYRNYFSDTSNSKKDSRFLDPLCSIMATIADNQATTTSDLVRGAPGTEKFLNGRNPGFDKWVAKIIPELPK